MRRRLHHVVRWLLLFSVWFGIQMVWPGNRTAENAAAAALAAALYATLFPWVMALIQRLRARKNEDEAGARWRTYSGGTPGRWRSGFLRHAAGDVATIPMFGDLGPRISPADVRDVGERPPTPREAFAVADSALVLEVELADRRIDLAVRKEDVADVRRWLGRP